MLHNHVPRSACCAGLIAGLLLLGDASSGRAAELTDTPSDVTQADDVMIAARAGGSLSEGDAKALERAVADHPDDRVARIKLLGYYFGKSHGSSEAAEARRRHIFWMIEHNPQARISGFPYAQLDPIIDGEAYRKGKALWLTQTAANPKDTAIFNNAASYLSLHDGAEAEKLWLQAQELEPMNPQWPERLAQHHSHQLFGMGSFGAADDRRELARRALKEYEQALLLTPGEDERFSKLDDLAKAAWRSGDPEKAAGYATEMLDKAKNYEGKWNYGNAIHVGHIVLGHVAMDAGDVPKAKMHLKEAGKTPGSPQLNSFGPSMSLAKDLLAKGEKDAVIEYLQLCGKFWSFDRGKLKQWTAAIEDGVTPDFGPNLAY